MKKVITYGTFDVLHYGHIRLLKRAKELGDYLIVALSTDEFNALKGKKSFYPYEIRKELLQSSKYVDHISPDKNWEQKISDVQKYNIDVFVIGSDWRGKFDSLKEYCEVVYLERTDGISSTKVRNEIQQSLDVTKHENI